MVVVVVMVFLRCVVNGSGRSGVIVVAAVVGWGC